MKTFKATVLSIASTLEHEHGQALEKADALSETLTRFKYEGKASFGRNLKEARDTAEYFEKRLLKHIKFEEDTIFPFLKTHIPKLEPVIHYLLEEHSDFREKLKTFSKALSVPPVALNTDHSWKWLEKVTESGTYLVYLLRQHTQAERTSLYEAIQGTLRNDEKKDLQTLVRQHWRKEAV